MPVDREFLGRLAREIASLKERIASKEVATPGHQTLDSEGLLHKAKADLQHLEKTRRK